MEKRGQDFPIESRDNSAQPMGADPDEASRTDLAWVSLVVGILSLAPMLLCNVGALAGIVLGVVALIKTKTSPVDYAGKKMAIAGIVTSTLGLAFAAAVHAPCLLWSQRAARETVAVTNVMRIAKAESAYAAGKGRGGFTDLCTLAAEGLIDLPLASGQTGGFEYAVAATKVDGSARFDVTARPVKVGLFGSGTRSFGSNETKIMYQAEGSILLKGTPENRIPMGGEPMIE